MPYESVCKMKFKLFGNPEFDRGAPLWKEIIWIIIGDPLFKSILMPNMFRASILRLFGTRVGKRGWIKNDVKIKFPWKLELGDDVLIGEHVWIDNLERVLISSNVCISQASYLCTGNHDWSEVDFKLRCAPIVIEQHAWVGAKSRVGPGITIKEGAVLTLGAVACRDADAWSVYSGNPAKKVKDRHLRPRRPD